MHDSIGVLYQMRQGPNESNDTYVECFENNAMTVGMVQGGHLFYSPGIVGKEKDKAGAQEIYTAREASLAVLLLRNSDPKRYGGLISRLKEGANLGRDEYPTSVASMYELMVKNDKQTNTQNQQNFGGRSRRGNTFAQAGSEIENEDENGPVAGNDGVVHPHVLCFNCQRYGHYSSSCPLSNQRRGGATVLLHGTCLTNKSNYPVVIEEHRLLLDTCSTDNVCKTGGSCLTYGNVKRMKSS